MTVVIKKQIDREFGFHESDFRFLSKLAYEKSGIVLSENKQDLVYGRLARRLRVLNLRDFSEYCTLLKSGSAPEEMEEMINAVTTNLTSFFREGHHFEHLRDNVLTPMLNKSGFNRLRIWSSACSSGMEAYSIAMILRSVLGNNHPCDAKILATDIDSNMVNIAAAGEYTTADIGKVPSSYKQYATMANGKMKMANELKSVIAFKQLNLLQSWPMRGLFDAIFCRNVMIYFDKPTKERLIDRMADLLPIGGWLYIGHSENLHEISDRFDLIGKTVYRRAK